MLHELSCIRCTHYTPVEGERKSQVCSVGLWVLVYPRSVYESQSDSSLVLPYVGLESFHENYCSRLLLNLVKGSQI